MAELADARDLKSLPERGPGSSPGLPTFDIETPRGPGPLGVYLFHRKKGTPGAVRPSFSLAFVLGGYFLPSGCGDEKGFGEGNSIARFKAGSSNCVRKASPSSSVT